MKRAIDLGTPQHSSELRRLRTHPRIHGAWEMGDGVAMGAELQGLRSIANDRSVVNHGPGQLLLSDSFMIMVCNKHDRLHNYRGSITVTPNLGFNV